MLAVRERLEEITGDDARRQAVIRHIVEQVCDTGNLMLQLEFKLFAVRHPQMLKELSGKHLEATTATHHQEMAALFAARTETEQQVRQKTLAIEALLEGFALNALFSPQVLDAALLGKIIPALVEDIVYPPGNRPGMQRG